MKYTDRTTDALRGLLEELGIELRHDIFLGQTEVRFTQGLPAFQEWQVYQPDPHQNMIKATIANTFTETRGKKKVGLQWSESNFKDALAPIVHDNRINPPYDYLKQCTRESDSINHENWLICLFDLNDNPYNRSVTRLITMGLVQRAVQVQRGLTFWEPGFKHYATLVGEGDLGKTTVLTHLLPKHLRSTLYTSVHVDMTANSEITEMFSNSWLIEACEMKGGSYTKNSKMKQFFDAHVYDHFRKKYDRQAQKHLRTWNCVGTTNDEKFLSDDPALANRFYPIRIRNKAEYREIVDFMDANRDSIFSCAMADYEAGGRAIVSDVAREYQKDIICDYMAQDHRLQVLVDKIIKETKEFAISTECMSVGDWLVKIGMASKEERRSESGKQFTFQEIQGALLDSGCFTGATTAPFVTRNGRYLLLQRTPQGSYDDRITEVQAQSREEVAESVDIALETCDNRTISDDDIPF